MSLGFFCPALPPCLKLVLSPSSICFLCYVSCRWQLVIRLKTDGAYTFKWHPPTLASLSFLAFNRNVSNDCAVLPRNQQLCAIIVISAVNGVNIFIRKRSCLLFWLCFSRCPFYLLINEYMDCVWTALTLTPSFGVGKEGSHFYAVLRFPLCWT